MGKEENLDAAVRNGAVVDRDDIRDGAAVRAAVDAAAPEVIFHLAAQMDVRKSVAQAAFDAETNVIGTINVLEAARRMRARVINASTGGAIYGETATISTPESVEPLPEAPYGLSKYCAEHYMHLYRRLFGTPGVSLRLGNVYGPRQDPLGEAGVIAIFCGCLEVGRRPTIYGTGRQTRDYVYVTDVVEAMLAVLDRPEAEGEFNVATGRASSILEIVEALAAAGDGRFEPVFAPPRAGEIEHNCLDVTRARHELGWTARTELADGLRATVDAAGDNLVRAGA
jgi:UDP-glucose 4-epimerase